MDITLVTSTINEDVHGTDNDKRTGCGISLIKPENVTRYRRGNKMTDLKEITCEKCKSALAKKIIRADKKEMSKIIKEERMKAKKGIEDELIVPLGNTVAKITGQQNARPGASSAPSQRPQEAPAQRAAAPEAPAAPAQAPVQNAPAQMPKTIAGTNVEIDSSLAQFAIDVPKEDTAPEAEAPVQDDFLAQFAIQKPDEEEQPAPAPVQDDFLAQFAINAPAPEQEQPAPEPAYTPYSPENSEMADISAADNEPAPQEYTYNTNNYYQASAPTDAQQNDYAQQPQSYQDDDAEIDLSSVSEWNMVANQIFGSEAPAANDGPAEMADLSVPVIDAVPTYEQPAAPVLDDLAAPTYEQSAAPVLDDLAAPVYEAPVLDDLSAPNYEQPTAPVLDDLAAPTYYEQPTAPVLDDLAAPTYYEQPEAPVLEDLAAPTYYEQPEAPVLEDLAAPSYYEQPEAPVLEDLSAAPSYEQPTAPVLEDLAAPAYEAPEAAMPEESVQIADSIEDAAAEIDSLFEKFAQPPHAAPVYTEPEPVQEAAPEPEAPVLEDLAAPTYYEQPEAPVQEEAPMPEPEPMPEIAAAPELSAMPGQYVSPFPTPVPMSMPYPGMAPFTAPMPAPVQAAAGQNNYESGINMNSYTSPGITSQPVPSQTPAQPAAQPQQPVQAAVPQAQPVQPQIITVPQLSGYDANGQPVYTYVQMKMTGFDAKGQPVFAPVQAAAPQAQPVQAAPQAQAQQPVQRPIQPQQPVQRPVQQTAQPQQPAQRPVQQAAQPQQPAQRPVQPQQMQQPQAAAQAPRQAAPLNRPAAPVQSSVPTANISKIAVNSHTKPTSQAFVKAISNSKSYANKNLIETQGMKANAPLLTSIEDVLSQIDSGSGAAKKPGAQAPKTVNPVYNEYKSPSQPARRSPAPPSVSRTPAPEKDVRFMTKSELKEKKKQDKIEAKFKKDMAKRGL